MTSHVPKISSPVDRTLFTWDSKFSKRQENLYAAEDYRVECAAGQGALDAFLTTQLHGLQPPDFSFDALRQFLETVTYDELTGAQPLTAADLRKLVYLDERKDPTDLEYTSRNWTKYAQYPPEGISVFSQPLNAKELFEHLVQQKVCSAGCFGTR
jgi:hypothetical protein